jgi:crotonobetainyl-CoA:carnitine CoA-transferase CaiB-like acyl-CoA transferase
VLRVDEMHTDPQALAREMIVETVHPTAGRVKAIGLPIKFSETPGAVRLPAPLFGQDTREVLRANGFSDSEIDQLAAQGVVQLPEALQKGTKR